VIPARFFAAALSFAGAGACTTTQHAGAPMTEAEIADPAFQQRIVELVRPWLGTPYKWRGTSRQGVDCSGFVHTIFAEAFGIELPRRSRDQARVGSSPPPVAAKHS
jgi:cell wall-associated NlpC family hydrolase